MAREIPVTQARTDLADLVNRVAYTGERVTLTRHGRPLAALVPMADLDALERRSEVGAEGRAETGSEIGFGLTQVEVAGAAAGRTEGAEVPEPGEPAESERPAPQTPAGPLRIAAHHRPPRP
jgi:prevent-host-death family protein